MEAQKLALIVIVVCSIMSAIYFEKVRYEEGKADLEFKKWDMQTCTASDYSVRLNIPFEWYVEF